MVALSSAEIPREAITSACIQPFEARCTVSMHIMIMSHTSAPLEFGEPASNLNMLEAFLIIF